MAVGTDTYIYDLLRVCGGAPLFAERGDRRYPIVELAEVERAKPAVILLPSEPYAFAESDVAELSQLP